METAFLLPMPNFRDTCRIPDLEPHKKLQAQAEIEYWSDRLEGLSRNKALWPELKHELKKVSESHLLFVTQFAATSEQQSLLHLAVLDDQMEWISQFGSQRELLERRNRYGLTPLDLALFLHKQKSASVLAGSSRSCQFFSQPHVTFESRNRPVADLEYLAQPVFESQDALEEVLAYTQKAKNEDAIPSDRIWMGVYYDTEIQKGIHPGVAVRWINEAIGFGVYASERILPLSYVGEYTGLIQKRKSRHVKQANYCFRYSTWPMGKHRYVVDAEHMGNFTRFINHSEHPNVGLVCAYWRGLPRLILISLQEIPKNGQLTIDYGPTFWKQSKRQKVYYHVP